MRIYNKRAKFDYELTSEKIEAGVSLSGIEAKSLREKRGDLSKSFVKIIGGEAFLVNANIPAGGVQDYNPTRTRKLLLHKRELVGLETKMKQSKLQLVPIVMYNKGRLIKLQIALGKSKRKFEKKEAIKKADIKREIEREFRGKD